MVKYLIVIPIAALALIFGLGCTLVELATSSRQTVRGSGRVIEQSRDIDVVHGVNLATLGTLTIELGDETALWISAEDNILPYITTEVRAGVLFIETEPRTNLRTTRPVRYTLTVVSLDEIFASSSGDIIAPDLEAETFSLNLSSSGDVTLGNLTCERLTAVVSSSGSAEIAGATGDALDVALSSSGKLTLRGGAFERQTVRLSSSGDYDARRVRTRQADLTLSSSGSASVWVEESLDASLSSSGGVRYAGDPVVDWSSSSSGTVRPLND